MVWNQDAYLKAWRFACEAHQGQTVPGSVLPYAWHFGAVAMEVSAVIAAGFPVQQPDLLVQCALLHDVVEDTDTAVTDLEVLFGQQVAAGVAALSKNSALRGKEQQMRDSLDRIKLQPVEVWMVKLADRITNLQPPPGYWSLARRRRYLEESKLIHQSLDSACPLLADRLESKMDEYRQFLLN